MTRLLNANAMKSISASLLLMFSFQTTAAVTDLAQKPLANARAANAKPNITFIMDDSGSMTWPFMPDDYQNREGKTGFYNYLCNTIYFNPNTTYDLPQNADQSAKPNSSFLAAWVNGFDQDEGTVNLSTSFKGDRGTPVTTWSGGNNNSTAAPAFYYEWQSTGNVPPSATECSGSDVDFGSSPGIAPPLTAPNAIDTTNGKSISSGNIVINGRSVGAVTGANNDSTFRANVRDAINTAMQVAPAIDIVATINGSGKLVLTTTSLSQISVTISGSGNTSGVASGFSSGNVAANISTAVTGEIVVDAAAGKKWIKRLISAAQQQNFANWYSYYRTRMLMMKSSVSQAFAPIGDTYRVGFELINNNAQNLLNLPVADFATAQKQDFYDELFDATNASGGTPLRPSLSKVGRMYAGQQRDGTAYSSTSDPVQYACQQNFTILATDGYWNGGSGFKVDGTTMDDQDGVTGVSRPSYDAMATADTLADVAYHYYHTDLRSGMANKVDPVGTVAAEDDVATHQHMTTFTLGLGLAGTLVYKSNYRNDPTSDYDDIKNGTKNWSVPVADTATALDDLWHAAVNGRGKFYVADNPDALRMGIAQSIAAATVQSGAAAAAATSTLEPVQGDNFAYLASYQTAVWNGELSARTIDPDSGAIDTTDRWKAGQKLNNLVAYGSDTRNIYTWDASATSKLKSFTYANLTAAERAYFNPTLLTQYATMSVTQQAAMTGTTLVNYLRGQRSHEKDRSFVVGGVPTTYPDQQVYRLRQYTSSGTTYDWVLGDISHTTPVYVGKPSFSYADTDYDAYKTAQTSRTPMIYVGANDGMLHAFDGQVIDGSGNAISTGGDEKWSYVPLKVMPNMYKTADVNYSENHVFTMDGPIAAGDVYFGNAASEGWHTILVGGFGAGGRGYYALDVTDPLNPKALWNFTDSENANMGYSYSTPIITKKADGTWVVLVTSGINNSSGVSGDSSKGDGKGYLYEINAKTGALLRTIATNSGSITAPSGLGKLNAWVDNVLSDNTATYAYAGDINGDVWRFDLAAGSVSKLIALGEPVTTAPELGKIDTNKVVFVGTGRYLGTTDITDTTAYGFYAVKDPGNATTVLKTALVQQTLQTQADGIHRTTINNQTVNWTTNAGWWVRFLDAGERVAVDPVLQMGTIVFSTNVPTSDVCEAGGYSWIYYLDYKTGIYTSTALNSAVATKITGSMVVGNTVYKTQTGKIVNAYITSSALSGTMDVPPPSSSTTAQRVQWRELLDD